jgi:hypothetical protein
VPRDVMSTPLQHSNPCPQPYSAANPLKGHMMSLVQDERDERGQMRQGPAPAMYGVVKAQQTLGSNPCEAQHSDGKG